MHITEGVAPAHIALAGAAIAAAGVAVGLRAMKDEQIPRAALMSSVIFITSLVVRLPFGPSSVHPILNGLAGLILGWASMPVFLVSLFLQALLFQFGGLTTLGINTVTMGLPAVACYYLFNRTLKNSSSWRKAFITGTAAGIVASLLSFGLWTTALVLSGKQLMVIAALALGPHIAITLIEGIFTGFIVAFLSRVYPEIFSMPDIMNSENGT